MELKLPKSLQERFKKLEVEEGLVDDCKYMLYLADDWSFDDDGQTYPVKTKKEAIEMLKHAVPRRPEKGESKNLELKRRNKMLFENNEYKVALEFNPKLEEEVINVMCDADLMGFIKKHDLYWIYKHGITAEYGISASLQLSSEDWKYLCDKKRQSGLSWNDFGFCIKYARG